VTNVTTYPVATALPGQKGRIRVGMLPNGDVLIGGARCDPTMGGPLATSPVAVLDHKTGKITPLPAPKLASGSLMTDVESSPDGKTVYVSTRVRSVVGTTLYAIAKGTIRSRLSYVGSVVGLRFSVNHDGIIHAADYTNSAFVQIQEVSGQLTEIKRVQLQQKFALYGPEFLRSTGEVVLTSGPGSVNNFSVLLSDKSGNTRVLTPGPPGGWGIPVDLALNNTFEPYGHGTPGANQYRIVDWPNPGGRPEAGNLKFSLTVQSTPGAPTNSFMVLGVGKDDFLLAGARVFINLAQFHVLLPMSKTNSAAIGLPLLPSYRGLRFFAQSAHRDAGATLATSNGVDIFIH
jgi:hypothetical protein